MAVVISSQERTSRTTVISAMMSSLRRQSRAIERLEKEMRAEGAAAAAIQTAVNALLVDWGASRDQIVTELTAIPIVSRPTVEIGMPALYSSANIEAANQSNLGGGVPGAIIRSNSSMEESLLNGPFHVFVQNDIVSISDCENPDNNITGIKVLYSTAPGGQDIILNGEFASTSNWTEASADIGITGGKAVFANATATLSQAKADMYNAGAADSVSQGWVLGTLYLVTFEVVLNGTISGTLSVGTNTTAAQHTVTAVGTHVALITGDGDAAGLIFTGTGFTGGLESVEMIPFSGLALNRPLGSDNAADTSLKITLQER